MPHATSQAWEEARFCQRFPTHFDALVTTGAATSPAMILNISAGGAMIQCTKNLRIGSQIALKARAFEEVATIIWARASRYGLRFRRPIRPLEIVRQNYHGLEHFRSARVRSARVARSIPSAFDHDRVRLRDTRPPYLIV